MIDIALLFPPQWSPFQPALSLPSLTAWLRRDGFSVHALDANIDFYHWLYRDASISHCKGLISRWSGSVAERMAYGAILEAASDFAGDIANLQNLATRGSVPNENLIRTHFTAINSMECFLDCISKLGQSFKISPFRFETAAGDYNSVAMQKLVEEPPQLLETFVDEYLTTKIAPLNPRSLGLSCIGQEQL